MKKYRLLAIIALITFVVVSCSAPSQASPTPAPSLEPSQTPLPTSTPSPTPHTRTPQPLHWEYLEPLVFQKGDLPPEFKPGPVSHELPEDFALDPPDLTIIQEIEITGKWNGDAMLFIYKDPLTLESVYATIVDNISNFTSPDLVKNDHYAIEDIGEHAYFAGVRMTDVNYATLVFRRCSAIVQIILLHNPGDYEISEYARKMDERLQLAACVEINSENY